MTTTYKGWKIDYDPKPIPVRDMDYTATSPDFDADCDQDGFHICSGQIVHGETFVEVLNAIEAAIEETEL